MRGATNRVLNSVLSTENGSWSFLFGVVAGVVILFLVTGFLTGCAATKEVLVPVPVKCPSVVVPPAPEYPTLAKTSTPKEVIQYFLLKVELQQGYIEQLTLLLKNYSAEPEPYTKK